MIGYLQLPLDPENGTAVRLAKAPCVSVRHTANVANTRPKQPTPRSPPTLPFCSFLVFSLLLPPSASCTKEVTIMAIKEAIPESESLTFQPDNCPTTPPDLRLLHYNDVYHVDASSAEPVGGIARFQTLANHYRDGDEFAGQPKLLTFFSGDAFNPCLESSVTKGAHMVPILNGIGTDVACVGVSCAQHWSRRRVLTLRRTTISTSASNSTDTFPRNAHSRGSLPMCSIPPSATASRSAMRKRRSC